MAFRVVTDTNKPVIDSIGNASIVNGSAAVVDDLLDVDRRQAALMYRFGSPPIWMSTEITNQEATVEVPIPPAVEYVLLGILVAGDGGLVASGDKIAKIPGNVDVTCDNDTNGTRFKICTHPTEVANQYTDIANAEFMFADQLYEDSETAQKVQRRLRVMALSTAMADAHTWGSVTMRFNVPATVKVHGIYIEPLYRQRPI